MFTGTCVAVNDRCPREGPGVGIAEINPEHNRLSRSSLQQEKFPHTHPLGKEKKKKQTQMATGQADPCP